MATTQLSTTLRSIDSGGFLFREHQVIGRQENPRHCHDYQCIGVLITGLGTAEFGREHWVVRPGYLNVIPAGVPHVERFGSPEIRWCGIEFQFIRDEFASEANRVFARPSQTRGGPAAPIAARIIGELQFADSASPLALHGLGLELLAVLARGESDADTIDRPAWLGRAEEYIRAGFLDPVSLNDVAAEVGIHPMHLSREFRRYFGVSIGAFVRNLRVDHAMVLLADPELSLAYIANLTGFYDQAHFTRVFKRRVRVSPGAFRAGLRRR